MYPEEETPSSQLSLEQQFALWRLLPDGCKISLRDRDDAHELVIHRADHEAIRREWEQWREWSEEAKRWGCEWIRFTYGDDPGEEMQSYGAIPMSAIQKLDELGHSKKRK